MGGSLVVKNRAKKGLTKDTFLLLGVGGLLGDEMFGQASNRYEDFRVFGFDHGRIDATSREQVSEVLSYIRPTVVVNCVGLSDPEACESAKALAYKLNVKVPELLASQCEALGARLVHFSTASVGGFRNSPFTERSKPSPSGVYAMTKHAGEQAVLRATRNYLLVRPGWLFHHKNDNHLTRWVGRFQAGSKVSVPEDAYVSPTYVPDLVEGVFDLIDMGAKGVFHVANSKATSWQAFAQTAAELMRMQASVDTFGPLLSKWFRSPQLKYSVLSLKKFSQTVGARPRDWPDALKQCLFHMGLYKP